MIATIVLVLLVVGLYIVVTRLQRDLKNSRFACEQVILQAERLAERVRIQEGQIESQIDAATGTVEDVLKVLPGISGDFGMRQIVRKLIYEVMDARAELKAARNAAALEKVDSVSLPDRIKSLSARAAIHDALMDYFGAKNYDGILEAVRAVGSQKEVNEIILAEVESIRKWLGAKEKETLRQTIQRVLLTLEVSPGAAKELMQVRNALEIAPSESVLQAIQAPMTFTVMVNRAKGKIVGASVVSDRAWPAIGDADLVVKDVG